MKELDKSKDKSYNARDMAQIEMIQEAQLDKFDISTETAVYRQVYEQTPKPQDVFVIKASVFKDEYGGHFLEMARFKNGAIVSLAEQGVDLNIKDGQANTAIIAPNTERFGHLHRGQDEMWVVSKGTLTVVLYDARKNSQTCGMKTRLVLSEGMAVRIPPGVVHGLANYTSEFVVLGYFANMQFSAKEDTQEWRFVPDNPDFWNFAKPDKI